ncbi:MAG: hypothetical protein KKF44_01025, partial [Nanoarchaeota archaeon]|nr:hypothetical protein [Nanoarchaeota archaeon]
THIAHVIKDCEQLISDLELSLKKNDFAQKDEDLNNLAAKLQDILEKITVLKEDVATIRLTELQQKNYVKVHDEQYLLDKLEQLSKMQQSLNDLIEILQEHPSDQELEKELLDQIYERMNTLIDSFNGMKTDDDHLKEIYEKVNR